MSGWWIYEVFGKYFIHRSIDIQSIILNASDNAFMRWMRSVIAFCFLFLMVVLVCLMMTVYSIQFSNQNGSTKCSTHPLPPNGTHHILGIMIKSKMLLWWRIMIHLCGNFAICAHLYVCKRWLRKGVNETNGGIALKIIMHVSSEKITQINDQWFRDRTVALHRIVSVTVGKL